MTLDSNYFVKETKVNLGDSNDNSDKFDIALSLASDGVGIHEFQKSGEILTRIVIDLTYYFEKLLNLEVLLMHVAARESDYKVLVTENRYLSTSFIEKGLEFDLLSGILDSEVNEMEKLVTSLQKDTSIVYQKISAQGYLPNESIEIEEKLHDAEESLMQSQRLILEMRNQSANFQRIILSVNNPDKINEYKDVELLGNGQFSSMSKKFNMQTAEQQRRILRMLEKSLARELDLEKKLSDSRNGENVFKQKLYSIEQEEFCLDDEGECVLERLIYAEFTAHILMGVSKDLIRNIHINQLDPNFSIQQERELGTKFQKTMNTKGNAAQMPEKSSAKLSDCVEKNITFSKSEFFCPKEKIDLVEGPLRGIKILDHSEDKVISEPQGDSALIPPEFHEIEKLIEDLKEKVAIAEGRAEGLDAKCILLTESNLELNEEIQASGNSMEKVNLLEKQLRESYAQLKHAKASTEVSQEQQNMLYAAILDMENLVEDLKSKVSTAETRAESAEKKCQLLSEAQLELRADLNYLKCTLHYANDEKIAKAKDISVKTKVITDLLQKLAMERNRLHIQVSSLRNKNTILQANAGNSASVTVKSRIDESIRNLDKKIGFCAIT